MVLTEFSFGEQFSLYGDPGDVPPPPPKSAKPASAKAPAAAAPPVSKLPQRVNGAAVVFKAFTELLTDLVGAEAAPAAALHVMRMAPGTVIHVPPMEVCEQLAREQKVVERLRRDPSPAAVQHTAAFHGLEVREAARTFKAGNRGRGLQAERDARSNRPGLTCRHPRLNRWRRTITV